MRSTTTNRRPSGIAQIGDLPWGTHFSVLYATAAELVEVLAPFIRAGLEDHELCAWEVAPPLDPAAVSAALVELVPGARAYLASGQLEIVPAPASEGDGAVVEWLERAVDRSLLAGFDGLRVVRHATDRAGARAVGAAIESLARLGVVAAVPSPRAQLGVVDLMDRVQEHAFALVRNSGRWELLEGSAARTPLDSLASSEARLRSLFGHMSEGFAYHRIVVDGGGVPCDYVFLEVNPAFERLTGLRAADLIGKRATQVLPGIERDPTDWIGRYGRVALTGDPAQFESHAAVLGRHYAVSAFSSQRGYFAVAFSEITGRVLAERQRAASERALRASEARFKLLSDSASLLLSTDDPQRVVSALCQAVMEHLECQVFFNFLADPAEDVLRLNAFAGIPEEEARKIERLEYGVAVCGCAARDRERIVAEDIPRSSDPRAELVRSYGVQAYCCHPLIAEGRLLGTLSFGTRTRPQLSADDVALMKTVSDQVAVAMERIRAQRELREANRRLQDADRRKDEFLALLSHELRNPLAPIRNSVYLLERAAPGGDQARRALEVIGRQTGHLARLVDDLLDVTRIARGKIALRRARLDLREVVTRTGEDFREVIAQRGLRFRCTAPDRSVWVDADETRIAQVIGNLLHNATKFTRPDDEVVLSLEVHGGHAELGVRDTGAGIEPDLVGQVFDAFVQGQRTMARTEGGLGLGLALVKGIAELHGGTVHAASEGKGKGAEFLVRLPLLEPRPSDVGAGGGPRTATAPPRNGRRRVLVVDDNVDAARALAEVVELLGHSAEVAHDGPSALAKARATAPDVVLCDIGLPGMSGYDVARALRAAATPARLLAVSGYAHPDDVMTAIAAGFHGHMAKPVSLEEIERLLA